MKYQTGFKKSIVRKMLLPDHPGISKIAEQSGVAIPTLYSWLNKYKESVEMADYKKTPDEWSLVEKQAAIVEVASLGPDKLGAWLRAKGLQSEHLKMWPGDIQKALAKPVNLVSKRELQDANKTIKQLKKEVTKKDKALAELTAILVLKKKLATLFEAEES
jgi:hypothetical protein